MRRISDAGHVPAMQARWAFDRCPACVASSSMPSFCSRGRQGCAELHGAEGPPDLHPVDRAGPQQAQDGPRHRLRQGASAFHSTRCAAPCVGPAVPIACACRSFLCGPGVSTCNRRRRRLSLVALAGTSAGVRPAPQRTVSCGCRLRRGCRRAAGLCGDALSDKLLAASARRAAIGSRLMVDAAGPCVRRCAAALAMTGLLVWLLAVADGQHVCGDARGAAAGNYSFRNRCAASRERCCRAALRTDSAPTPQAATVTDHAFAPRLIRHLARQRRFRASISRLGLLHAGACCAGVDGKTLLAPPT
jgi:hypothetical protein